MILIFDLDDTLYNEIHFVESGLEAVAQYAAGSWGLDRKRSYRELREILENEGRGAVFDVWLERYGMYSRHKVKQCVRTYRHHQPQLELFPTAARIILRYSKAHPLYIVTDGHKVVQKNKIDALQLWPVFRRIFITHRFGLAAAKPSTYCFELIRRELGCRWSDMVYIGDNPSKDFINLNPLGVHTVRVLTGSYRSVEAGPQNDATFSIPDLDALPDLLIKEFA